MARTEPASDPPFPGTWGPAERLARRALAPVERFLHIEAASGIVLLVVAVVALGLANSPWADAFAALWHTPLGIRLGPFAFERDLHFWVNDGLMTIFFFVVGLEIRREIHRGELSDLRRAALPIAAAIGGMIAPACIYAALNHGRPSLSGWGVPMATDIAFAVGVLALLGNRVPPALRVLLLALAVIDDLGAILVIAFFYSAGIEPAALAVALPAILVLWIMNKAGVRTSWAYVPAGAALWAGVLAFGVHPTLAGVIIGLMTPVQAGIDREHFVARAGAGVRGASEQAGSDEAALIPYLADIDRARREAVSPVERIQHALHGWVAFGIMPLFALANAGVPIGGASLGGDGARVLIGVSLGLVLGKPIGILAVSWLAVRLRLAALPRGIGWPQVGVVGLVAGIGFTMALFIAQLAFPAGPALEIAKLGILAASTAAGLAGYAIGRAVLSRAAPLEGATSESEAESSTVE